ncbi:hypothetical protein [Niveibacterium sp. SC-1]|uniref:hypothetical protein n=1 Tax=Niveibacterium sp. SC-1 TaxID=3135646 RepID=UPI00311EB533
MTLPLPLQLPLLLAGPILRRVEPTMVCVWVALSENAALTLRLWEGRVAFDEPNVFVESQPEHQQMLRVGQRLFVGMVALKIDATSPKKLQPARLYSYDIEVRVGADRHTLKTLGLLRDGVVDGHPVKALGYADDELPHFALPPTELTDLRILFGSCRRPGNSHLDAMVYIDDMMIDHGATPATCPHADPARRPHQLFLGGDQIYADDSSPLHLSLLIELARELIGRDDAGEVRERLPLDHIRKASTAAPNSLDDYGPGLTRGEGGSVAEDFLLPADTPYFPPARRYLSTTVEAQMTSTDGQSHLFGFGEFAAMYLSVWSNAVWPTLVTPTPPEGPALQLPDSDEIRRSIWKSRIPTFIDAPLEGVEAGSDPNPEHDGADPRDYDPGKDDKRSPFQNYPPESERVADGRFQRSMEGQARNLTTFYLGLSKVRRVLANVPTYMIFDDHDVTDDWNLNPIWMDRVFTASLGVATMRNGLCTYALFQDWGNNPLRYLKDAPKQLLERIGEMFPPGTSPGPVPAAAQAIDTLLGLDRRGAVQLDGSVDETRPPMKWHFSVPGPKHLAIALDNRTRRSFLSRNGPPGNVARSAQAEQVPPGPFTDGKEVLIVIAPLQVIGPPLLDELIAPAAYKVFDMIGFAEGKARAGRKEGARGMLGTNPDAIEAWAFDPGTMEALLARLAPYGQVVLLSGDVHYSASNAMSYWRKGIEQPARFIQFTSSGMKNVMPAYITLVDRSLPFAQRLIRSGIGAERIGWLNKPANPLVFPIGKDETDVPRALRAKLRQTPTMLPNHGWPEFIMFNPAEPPDWSWRVVPLLDLRPDPERPPAEQPLAIDENAVQARLDSHDDKQILQAYQSIAARHQRQMEAVRNSRQILFRSNVGLVRFEMRDGALHAIHEAFTAFKPAGDLGTDPPVPAAFFQHAASFGQIPNEHRPETVPNARLDLG